MNDSTYKIEANDTQIRALAEACEFHSRAIVGQLDGDFRMLCEEHYKRNHPDATEDERYKAEDEIEEHIKALIKLCWDKGDGSYNGVRYDKRSDLLYEMRQSLDKARYDTMPEENKILLRYTNMAFGPSVKYSGEPFLKIEEINNENTTLQ